VRESDETDADQIERNIALSKTVRRLGTSPT